MAMVQPKSQKARLFITHLLLLLFIAAIMSPLLMVVAISLRQGNFATGSLIPEQISWDHWKLALGFSVEQADGRITPPPESVLTAATGQGGRPATVSHHPAQQLLPANCRWFRNSL